MEPQQTAKEKAAGPKSVKTRQPRKNRKNSHPKGSEQLNDFSGAAD